MLPKEFDDIFQVQLSCVVFTGYDLLVINRLEVLVFLDHMVD